MTATLLTVSSDAIGQFEIEARTVLAKGESQTDPGSDVAVALAVFRMQPHSCFSAERVNQIAKVTHYFEADLQAALTKLCRSKILRSRVVAKQTMYEVNVAM